MNRRTIKGKRLIEMESAPCLQGFSCLAEDIGIIAIVRLQQSVKLMRNHRLRPDIKSEVRDILLSLARPVNTSCLIYHFVLTKSSWLIVMRQSAGALGRVLAWSSFLSEEVWLPAPLPPCCFLFQLWSFASLFNIYQKLNILKCIRALNSQILKLLFCVALRMFFFFPKENHSDISLMFSKPAESWLMSCWLLQSLTETNNKQIWQLNPSKCLLVEKKYIPLF